MDNGYSLADYRAATENTGWGGGLSAGIGGFVGSLIGNGGLGFGGFGGGRGDVATTEELAAGFNFSGINNKLNELTAGQAAINQNLGNAICQSTYELANKIDNCCCNTQLAIKDLTATVVAEGAATRNLIQENKIESLQAQINQLQLQSALCGVPRINPYGYGVYAYPTCAPTCGTCSNI